MAHNLTASNLQGGIVTEVKPDELPVLSIGPAPTLDSPIDEENTKEHEFTPQGSEKDLNDDTDDSIIVSTGAIAAEHMLSARDDGDPAITLRSLVLGTATATFFAVMSQIYLFKPTNVSLGGSFIVLITYFLGLGWAKALPRGDILEARWRSENGDGALPFYIRLFKLLNPHEYGLKEHAIAAITASSATNGAAAVSVFATQMLYYPDNPVSAMTVILGTLSIGLFGYGLTGIFSPVTVNSAEAVYWTQLPMLSVLQSLHWDKIRDSKRLRWFWYAFGFMTLYEVIPGYMFPWLNSVSLPCLAAMHATGSKAATLTNIFGGSLNNEGLGILNFTFDWQYITSGATSLPLLYQANSAVGIIIAYIAMSAVYYGNAWNALSQPFMSTRLRTASGGVYKVAKVFTKGVLDREALAEYGLPHLTGTYAWASMTGNAAIGALIAHTALFWGGDIIKTIKTIRKGEAPDRHYLAMQRYKATPWYWFIILLVISFAIGLAVVLKDNVGMTAGSYVVALVLGAVVAPFSTVLYSRFGSGIGTNQLMKMVAGSIVPGRPLGNLYFTAWSHSTIAQSLNLAADLKLGIYLKIPHRAMFLTQIWGTVFGAFINYVVMVSIVNEKKAMLLDTNGSYAWSGQYFQSLNTQATTWSLAKELYGQGKPYFLVPLGVVFGFGLVALHRLVLIWVPKIGRFDLRNINMPLIIMYSGWMGYNQTQTSTILSGLVAGFFVQYYLRNFRPRIFKNYSYLITAALDGGSLFCMFILSFTVFGAAGNQHPFPNWWGNPADGYPDHCPVSE